MFIVVLLLVLWPVVEIAVFLQVVQWIGVLDTFVLMLAISLFGAWLIKRQGVGTLARMRAELDDGRIPTGPMTDGGLLAVAGFLLLVPGFVTDVFGFALLLPPVRSGRAGLARAPLPGAGAGAGMAPTGSGLPRHRRGAADAAADRAPPHDPPELMP